MELHLHLTSYGPKIHAILLRTQEYHAIVSNPHSGKRFIPRQKLQEICNERAVAKELARMFPENDTDTNERLTLSICYGRTKDPSIASQSCRKIFAILVLIHEPRLIESFLDHPLCDNDLPLSFDPRFYNALWAPKLKPIRHVKFPDDIDHYWVIKNFTNEQWSVLAPSFEADTTGKGCKVYEFHENDILPIEADPRYTYGSGSGLVEKVKIHSEHNGLGNDYFRLRTTRTSLMGLTKRDIRFKQELDVYQKGMVHIIEICAAFQQGDCRGFLFPWPGGGSLNDLWAKDPGNVVTTAGVKWSEFSRWICTQCHGIIKTIQAIHEPSGTLAVTRDRIQNDIRPHNILHFIEDGPPLGMLKFSDIRLMRFPRNGSWPGESFKAYLQYMAPEPNVRPWEVDIWAFGCLFAEFLTWAIRGRNGLEAFKLKREYDDRALSNKNRGRLVEANFFVIKSSSPGRPSQKSSIKEWFAELTDDLGPGMANTFFPQFLRIIEASMLEPNQERRADCEQVESYLGHLLQENPPDSPYWHFKGTTQYRKRRG
ncbi:hypothetical protein CFAM422_010370 [Trichoderma lentiforme]|uniref:Protein kinase domain-containing protein n=1 Tax=Trichoderma lentiforme TaxID=1567552 RepID=A0A9P4X7L0_9HYPO|nr:hypothetical protein CFAM422_010370 [Trichoderma lentiforme]